MGDLSKHFSRWEFACKCKCGRDTADAELLEVLEDLRQHFNQPIEITSAHRCREYNKKVGGGDDSQHIYGRAADIKVAGVQPRDVQTYLKHQYHGRFGIGSYSTFTHVDTRTNGPARW